MEGKIVFMYQIMNKFFDIFDLKRVRYSNCNVTRNTSRGPLVYEPYLLDGETVCDKGFSTSEKYFKYGGKAFATPNSVHRLAKFLELPEIFTVLFIFKNFCESSIIKQRERLHQDYICVNDDCDNNEYLVKNADALNSVIHYDDGIISVHNKTLDLKKFEFSTDKKPLEEIVSSYSLYWTSDPQKYVEWFFKKRYGSKTTLSIEKYRRVNVTFDLHKEEDLFIALNKIIV